MLSTVLLTNTSQIAYHKEYSMNQYLVEYITSGVSRPSEEQVGAYNESDAIRRIRERYGFNKVTIKGVRKAN